MNIDVHTLFVVHALISGILACFMIVFWSGYRSMPGLGLWALGITLLGLAILGAALRDVISDFFSVVVGTALAVTSFAVLWNGIRLFDGRPARWTVALLVAAATTAFSAYYTYVGEDAADRIAVIRAVVSTECALCTYELIRGPARRYGSAAILAAVSFGFMALALAFRAVSIFMLPPEQDAFAPSASWGFFALVSIGSNFLVVVAFPMMVAERLQRQLKNRNAELEAARAQVEEASRAKSEFLATFSHELRTPLNAVIGFSDAQRQEIFGPLGHPRYREYADDIHASGKHLLDLITTILDISKAEARKLEVEALWLDPLPIIEAALRLIRGASDAKRIRLSTDTPEVPLQCFADPQALTQILINLLSNATKFTPEGGAVSVEFRARAARGVEFVVRDTGSGIAAVDLPRLMKPFEQAERG